MSLVPPLSIMSRALNDIKQIEIIRDPGSVTYGSDAIGGVINIITHNADSSDGVKLGVKANERYRYQNMHLSYRKNSSDLSYYIYCSFNLSDGNKDTDWYNVDRRHGYGYMSPDWENLGTGSSVPDYYSDPL